ncbi:hypothetical protein DL93DRAFT_2074783 [Clavulina sp. PMI_390]|nr:hypothetical protein DL93DRAFT_2074783 [Clavulina sp. PMI_390]
MPPLKTRLDPVKCLPVELVQRVVYYIVARPTRVKQITTLSHVSRSWRLVVFWMPKLFVSPDLVAWPNTVIKDWVSRSRGLPLDIDLIEPDDADEPDEFPRILQRVMSFAPRLRSLRVETASFEKEQPLTAFFDASPHFPLLQTLYITTPQRIDLPLNLSKMPVLRTINIPFQSFRAEGSLGILKEIGCGVSNSTALTSLVDLASCQNTPFHLIVFTNAMEHIPKSFASSEISKTCWKWLISLRLDTVGGYDRAYSRTFFSQFHAPKLRLLELIDIDTEILTTIIKKLPSITMQSVETLVITSDRRYLEGNFAYLTLRNSRSQRPQAFPNLLELVFRDAGSYPFAWTQFSSMEECLSSRRSTIKRLTLPGTFRPKSNQVNDGETLKEGDDDRTRGDELTLQEEAKLIAAGNLDEIRYEYEVDDHGMGLAPYLS